MEVASLLNTSLVSGCEQNILSFGFQKNTDVSIFDEIQG